MRYSPVFLACLLLAGCGAKEEEPAKPLVAVKVARAEIADLRSTVRAPASLFPREQANVSARITAPIRELRVRKGDTVAAGQVLAVLEDRDLAAQRDESAASVVDAQANLEKLTAGTLPADVERARGQVALSEAALNQAQKYYERRSELFKQGAIPGRDLLASQTDLAQAKANHEVARRSLELLEKQSREKDIRIAESRVAQAKAHLSLAEAQLRFTRVEAPFAGAITEQFQYPGDMAKPDSPIFTLMDLATAIARAQVPESDAAAVRAGQACSFAAVDGGAAVAGRVTVVNRAVDPARRTVEVWCEMPNAAAHLRAGQFGNAEIVTGAVPHAVVVPLAAVQFAQGTRSGIVYVVGDKRAARRVNVETGEPDEGRVPIRGGLKPGDLVIVEGGYGLPDGTEVQYK